jgi:AcrR family transcriptional regulator
LQTEQRVFEVATRLFAARGFFGVGIREIATGSGFTVASLYHYMKTKEELLERLMKRALLEFTAGARTAVQATDEPIGQLAGLVEMSVVFHAVNPLTSRVVDKEFGSLAPEARQRVVDVRDEYERIWTTVLEGGVRSGDFRVPHVTLARLGLLGMCAEVAYWYSPSGPLSIPELRDSFVDMALRMVDAHVEERPACLLGPEDCAKMALEEPGAVAAAAGTS